MKQIKILEKDDPLFPIKLKEVRPKVKRLYIEGNERILNNLGIAIIGSRNSSKEGEKITEEIVTKLVKKDIIIISGLAKGIDSKAHQVCINSGGKTIAVIGSGFNNIYPKENEKIYKRIIETGGTIVSEYPPDTPVDSRNFPKRNRIISGLSEGVVMIEGKYRSGTTITAQYALNQNKKVFCLPHSISNSYGIGPNSIIQKGGILITKADDIIKEFHKDGIKFKEKEIKKNYKSDILKLLSKEILTKEELSIKTNKSISEINQELTILELEGIITEEYRERIQNN